MTTNRYLCQLCYKLRRSGVTWRVLSTVRSASTSLKDRRPEVISDPYDPRISEVIDVRTPDEFQRDHVPGAVNLPVLSNRERVEVGTLYSANPFQARKSGAANVTKNIAQHIEDYFQTKPMEYSPLIYCWRGGQRSTSMALVLSQIGFSTYVLDGGYKAYRAAVKSSLETLPTTFTYNVVSGLTGSGKTLLLQHLKAQGGQVLDLEGLAKHKGSVLGLWHGETQPSQKYWESLLYRELRQFDNSRPVWVESESMSIGKVYVPKALFSKMCHADRYKVCLPLEERVRYTIETYPNWINDVDSLKSMLAKLVKIHGHKKIQEWNSLVDDRQWEEFVSRMLTEHYDPSYTRSQTKNNLSSASSTDLHIPDLSEKMLTELALQLTQSDGHRPSHQCAAATS